MDIQIILRPWVRSQADVKEGLSDFMVTLPTPSRLEYPLINNLPF